MKITGIILAGGKSSRMGTDKGLLLLNGQPMVQYVIDILKKVTSKIIIISNNPDYNKFGLEIYEDLIIEKGPVGGIYTGLTKSKTDINICVSCDTPFINQKLLNLLLSKSEGFDVTVSSFKNRLHPLIGIYKKSAIPVFKKSLANNHLKLDLVNKELNYNIIQLNESGFPEEVFANINTPTDLKKIK